ncbi:hypothetical protein BpHYR1_018148 [Brachionus plicatilis]|uniref:Uncharacterized protein n=1 Tax=Brachionus plicatilis TaxID=10195 RepID=A0A3M7QDF3_BRAPC|nr:hypothetical protein BpHYR1_018148 [Brachionus plicatilis]
MSSKNSSHKCARQESAKSLSFPIRLPKFATVFQLINTELLAKCFKQIRGSEDHDLLILFSDIHVA